MISKIN